MTAAGTGGARRRRRALAGAPRLGRVGLIGCGHIGGSLALALKQVGMVREIVAADVSAAALERARALGICDETAPTDEDAARGADLVVLAAPVRAIPGIATRIAGVLRDGAIVTDVGSTKLAIVKACEQALEGRGHFVGGHPMAGTEKSGPESADPLLFEGRRVFLTPTPRTDGAALATVAGLWEAIGARIVQVDAAEHDRILAAVSHLPHVAAYALAAAAAAQGVERLAGFAGTSFEHSTRVAATAPGIWIDIFLDNREALLPLVDALAARVGQLRQAIAAGDAAEIGRLLVEGRAARQRILGA